MVRRILTDAGVAALKPKAARYAFPDPELRSHYVRVTPNGSKSFVVAVRDPDGKQVWATVGTADLMSIEEGREAARSVIKRIRSGLPAVEPKAAAATFKAVADNFIKRHVQAKALRTEGEMVRCLTKYVYPTWADRDFASIRRGDVAALLDRIEDDHGPRQADAVLAVVRAICNWFASRTEDYTSPIVRAMRRTDVTARRRDRILNDDEIRLVWARAADQGAFGALVKFALCTAQRREKVSTARWSDISIDGVWTVPNDGREKGAGGTLKLPPLALDIVRAQDRIGDNPHIFPGRGGTAFNNFSKSKAAFDKGCKIEPWTLHDLRRSARSLMSRVGIRPDISERVLGHVQGGVQGIYDRHSYDAEKADALARLARLLESILDPQPNVVPIRGAAQ